MSKSSRLALTGIVGDAKDLTGSDLRALPGAIDDGATGLFTVPISTILEAVGLGEDATHATVINADGDYRASIPLDELLPGGWLAVPDGGGELRLTVTGGRTLCWNVKDVATIHITDHAEPDDVPENPPH